MTDQFCSKCGHATCGHYIENDIKLYQCWERLSHDNNDFCGCTHNAPAVQPPPKFVFYAVANDTDLTNAKWYRTYTKNSNSGWVKDFADAKIWTRRGPAQGKCTNLGPGSQLVEFTSGKIVVIDQRERLRALAAKECVAEQMRQHAKKKQELIRAEAALLAAQENFERLNRE